MHPQKLNIHQTPLYLDTNVFENSDELNIVGSQMHTKKDVFPIDMHKHNFYEINIIYKGSGYHYIEDKCFEAKTGSVFVIPPGLFHGYYTENNDSFMVYNIFIKSSFIEKYKKELNSISGYSMLFEIEPYIRKETETEFYLTLSPRQLDEMNPFFLELLDNKFDNKKYISSIGLVITIISKLSLYLIDNHNTIMNKAISLKTIDPAFILKTMYYMNSNYYEKISIDFLASMANMSRSTYIRHFEEITKKTPNEYLTDVRIKEACTLLKETSKSITDISNECGFFDPSHFSKTFFKLKNITPLKYRSSL